MMRTSITRKVVPLALMAVGGVGLYFGITQLRRAIDANAVAEAAVSPPSRGDQDQRLTAVAAAQAEAQNVAAALSGPSNAPGAGSDGRPTFDVARIEPSGDAVIAGRAAPGASVELLRNGQVHDRVAADKFGQFAMVPPRLPAGDYELTLRSRQPNGTDATSKDSVVVALQPNLKDRPVVALMRPDKPSVVLSKPAGPNSTAGSVAVEMVETEPSGKLHVSGRSPPGAAVKLYLNDSYSASTIAAADGRFAFTFDAGVSPGSYRVRLDEVDPNSGAIRSRAEVPFSAPRTMATNATQLPQASQNSLQTAKPRDVTGSAASQQVATASALGGLQAAATGPKAITAVVSRGDSLWRISRSVYGAGERYTVIYGANQGQIRNPNLIYPGQVLVLPEKAH